MKFRYIYAKLLLVFSVLALSSIIGINTATNNNSTGFVSQPFLKNDFPAVFEPAKREETSTIKGPDEAFSTAPLASSLKTYQEAAYNAGKLSSDLREKLSSIPLYLWKSTSQRVIISFEDQASLEQFSLLSTRVQKLEGINMAIATSDLENIAKLASSPGVKRVYLDQYALFIDADWESQSDSFFEIATFPSEARIGARDLLTMGYDGSGVTIAIVDTGIDKTHPDLDDLDNNPATNDPKVIKEASFVDFDNDGVNDTSPMDQHGHGTHVAGIAAGNGLLKGVAPQARLMNARVLDAFGGAQFSWIMNGVNWAVTNGADVISMSLGGFPGSLEPLLDDAVNAAWENGVMVVIAAGNSGPIEGTVSSPGLASRAITVGASDLYDAVTSFSSRGPSPNGIVDPDIVAPGDGILSTVLFGQYMVASGTSMATPAVAGGLALLLQAKPTTPIDFIRASILATAKDLGMDSFSQGAGILDLKAALNYLQAPSVYAYPGFTSDKPLVLSPGETFSYQLDVFLNESFTSLSVSASSNLVSDVVVSITDTIATGWVRAKVTITMPNSDITGSIDIKNGTRLLYQVPLSLKTDNPENDAESATDAGETFAGALSLTDGTKINGYVTAGDSDFYSFAVTKNNAYRITLDDMFDDADVFLFDENGTIITISTRGGIQPENIEFLAKSTGDYYLRIISSEATPYSLLITDLGTNGGSSSVLVYNSASGQAQNRDSDPKYEDLVFSIQVTVNVPGQYDFLFTVAQYRSDYLFGKYVFYGDWLTFSLDAGTQTVELSIPGELLAASTYGGSYVLNDLLIGDPSTWTVVEYLTNVTQTPSYTNTDFEAGTTVINSITYSTHDVDLNGNPEFFTITLDVDFSDPVSESANLFVVDDSQVLLVYSATVDIYTESAESSFSIAFVIPGQLLEEVDQKAIIAGVLLPGLRGLVPLFDPVTNVPNYESLYTVSFSDTPADVKGTSNMDSIELSLIITSKLRGYMSFSFRSLYSTSDEKIAIDNGESLDNQGYALNVGTNSLKFTIDLSLAAARGIPGPYLLLGTNLVIFYPVLPLTGIDASNSPEGYYNKPFVTTNSYDDISTYEKPDLYLTGDVFIQEYNNGSDRGYEIIVETYSQNPSTPYLSIVVLEHTSLNRRGFYNRYSMTTSLSSGLQNVTFQISGKEIFQKRFIGYLEIGAVNIYDTAYDWDPIDSIIRAGLIKRVDYRNYYDIVPIYLTDYSLNFVNSDSDPLLEAITITLNVTVNTPSSYEFVVGLSSEYPASVSKLSSINALSAGNYSTTLTFDAKDIVRQGINGMTMITFSLISSDLYWFDEDDLGLITVNSSALDYLLPISFSGKAFSNAVDDNNDGLYDKIELSVLVNVSEARTFTRLRIDALARIKITDNTFLDAYVGFLQIDQLSLQKGLQNITFILDSTSLIDIEQAMIWTGTKYTTFTLAVDSFSAQDNEGTFYITTNEFDFPETYDLKTFDLTLPVSLDDINYELVYDLTGNAIAIDVIIEYSVNKVIPFSIDVFLSASTEGNFYYSGVWVDIAPATTGSFSKTIQFSFFELFGSTETPGSFDLSISASAYTSNSDFLDSLSLTTTISSSDLTIPVSSSELGNEISSPSDKNDKGFFLPLSFNVVIITFATITAILALNRKRS